MVQSCERAPHDQRTIQVCQRGEWVLFQVFPHLTMKEHPGHVYSNSIPEANTLTNNHVHNEHGVAHSVRHISFIHLCKQPSNNL